MNKILIIEDNVVLCRMLCNWLERKGLQTEHTGSVVQARKLITSTNADIILSDIRLSDGDGVEDVLKWMNKQQIRIPFIVMTEYSGISSAVQAMKLGAEDYLPKPINPDKLYSLLRELLQRRNKPERSLIFRRESRAIREMERRAQLVANTDMSVLIRGDSGTGKEHVARSIHAASPRAGNSFVAVDCGAIPKELAASEFFGHTKGAFTGAMDDKLGVLNAASGGTLFLDEVCNLPYEIQALLLRALQERSYRPVGGKQEMNANVRIIAATNEHIGKAIETGRFREDLYHRLCEFIINVPSLAECREDILPLAEFFREQSCIEFSKKVIRFDAETQKIMQAYGWPGNVRELRHCVRSAVLLADNDAIGVKELDIDLHVTADGYALKAENEEREHIIKALDAARNNKAMAANLLKISRPTLYEKMKKYGIE
ncbi:MAG: sigma-54 dependent transcriptional regulator [Paludibacter sp.]|nr:sigma-54 dependent transcriptional regulator [Paludibacter sp.]